MPTFSLSAQEKSRFILVTFAFMCVTSAALVARTAADTLFLDRFGTDDLAYMYVGTAWVVSSVAFVYSALIGRLSVVRLIGLSVGFLIILLLMLRVGLAFSLDAAHIAAYFAGDLVVHVPMMLFWSFAVFLFDPRQAKRLFGFIGAGGTLSCILVGFVVKPIAVAFGTPALIYLIGLLLIGFFLTTLRLSKQEPDRFRTPPSTSKSQSQSQQFLLHIKTPQIRHLILFVFVANVALALIDYQFKAAARTHYQAQELAGFFGNFYAYTSIIALIIQLFLVHRILQKGGIKVGLSLLPLGILIGCIGTTVTAAFSWIVGTKVLVQIFLFTIDIAAVQMLYMGIPVASRNQARAFADGITKPIAIATAGLGLIGIAHLVPLHLLAIAGTCLALVWLVLVHINNKAYVSALIRSLGTKKFDLSNETALFQDHTVENYIRENLHTAKDDDIVYLMDMLPEISNQEWTAEHRALIHREDPQIKVRALKHLQIHGTDEDLAIITPHLDHHNPQVRSESIRAVSVLGDSNTLITLERFLKDANPAVRSAAIASLVNLGDLDLLIDAGIALRDLLKSNDPSYRIAAAEALSNIHDSVLHRSLDSLLQDPDVAVRRAALDASRSHPSLELVPTIIQLLADPEIGRFAAEVLAELGPDALPHILPYLTSPTDPPFQGAHNIPNILVQMGDPSMLPTLLEAANTPDNNLRHQALIAYAKLLKLAPANKTLLAVTYVQIKTEITLSKQYQKQLEQIGTAPGILLLADALRDISQLHLKNAFQLIDALLPDIDAPAILETLLRAPKANNNALEILDNTLPKQIKQDVIDFFESTDTKNAAQQTLEVSSFILNQNDPWVICGALMATVRNHLPLTDKEIQNGLHHTHSVVRETTLFALYHQNKPDFLYTCCEHLSTDANPTVQELAKAYLSELSEQSGTTP